MAATAQQPSYTGCNERSGLARLPAYHFCKRPDLDCSPPAMDLLRSRPAQWFLAGGSPAPGESGLTQRGVQRRCNVDMLKLIQLGLTFANAEGKLPVVNGELCVWQFNFRCAHLPHIVAQQHKRTVSALLWF